jgi:hypothetical protein
MTGQVEIIPGKGLVFNNDTIIIHKCTPKDLCKILNIKDTIEIDHASVEDYDFKGELINNGLFAIKTITFHEFEFQFSGYKDDEILLKNIYINMSKPYYAIILSKTKLKDTDISVVKKYRKSKRKEMDSRETTLLTEWSNSGITFLIDTKNKKILKISVHKIDKE